MSRGKRLLEKEKPFRKKPVLLLVSMIVLLAVAVSGTVALLVALADPVTNRFTLETVPNEIEETIESGIKKNVYITNTGASEAAYIRAAVIVNWAADTNNDGVYDAFYGTKPVLNTDYTIVWNFDSSSTASAAAEKNVEGHWKKGADGYYYFTGRVPAAQSTDVLIVECKLAAGAVPPENYVLSVEIASQSIQADGTVSGETDPAKDQPVELAWGVSAGGSVIDANDGTLKIQQ